MNTRQSTKDEHTEQLEKRLNMMEMALANVTSQFQQLSTQIGTVSAMLFQNKDKPWMDVFGDRYKAVLKTLNMYIPFEAISSIVYSQGTRIPYVTGFYVYSAMNSIFGPDMWSYTVSTVRSGPALYNATVTISIAGVIRTNGSASKQVKGNAPEQLAMKSAITSAFKRAAANFGNVLGLCLYDKAYIAEFNKAKQNDKIMLNEGKVLQMLYEKSHPEKVIDTAPMQKGITINNNVHKEGVEESPITDLKEPENADEEIRNTHGPIPVAPVNDKTEYTNLVPRQGVITYTKPDTEKDVLKRNEPSKDTDSIESILDSIWNES